MTGGGEAPRFSRGLLTTERRTLFGWEKCQSQIEQSSARGVEQSILAEFAFEIEE